MADKLLAARGQDKVGINQPNNFVQRVPGLKPMFNWKYNYQRALQEDPKVIRGWFDLIANIKAKYGIPNNNIYNINKSGFIMGIILTGVVITGFKRWNWLKQV